MQAVILAGGLGARLRSVVPDRPKPMALIHGRPFLEYLIASFQRQGVVHLVLCTGYRGEQIESYFTDGSRWGVSMRYSREMEPLGTAGALKLAEGLLEDRFFVVNGDTFCLVALQELIDRHVCGNACATVSVSGLTKEVGYGKVSVDEEGVIVGFIEKVKHGLSLARETVNAGCYVLDKSVVTRIQEGTNFSLEKSILPELIERGKRVLSHPCQGFLDIGTPERLRRFEEFAQQELIEDLFGRAAPGVVSERT